MTNKLATQNMISGLLLDLLHTSIQAAFQDLDEPTDTEACSPEPKLPAHPPVPAGYAHWEYRGVGWRSEGLALYATLPITAVDRPGGWLVNRTPINSAAYDDLHYIEAVKAPEVKLPPFPPVPEGYDYWERRGYGWKSRSPVKYATVWAPPYARSLDTWHIHDIRPTTGGDLHYIEAVKAPEVKLPPHPPVPAGYDHWEYRGVGWQSDGEAWYATLPVNKIVRPGGWFVGTKPFVSAAYDTLHYLEAVKVADSEVKLPPFPPVPTGYDYWERRGYGWKSRSPVKYATLLPYNTTWHVYHFGTTTGDEPLFYIEAMKLPAHPPVPAGYDHWEYRGVGWQGEGPAMYASLPVTAVDRPQGWFVGTKPFVSAAYDTLHYLEAVKRLPREWSVEVSKDGQYISNLAASAAKTIRVREILDHHTNSHDD